MSCQRPWSYRSRYRNGCASSCFRTVCVLCSAFQCRLSEINSASLRQRRRQLIEEEEERLRVCLGSSWSSRGGWWWHRHWLGSSWSSRGGWWWHWWDRHGVREEECWWSVGRVVGSAWRAKNKRAGAPQASRPHLLVPVLDPSPPLSAVFWSSGPCFL